MIHRKSLEYWVPAFAVMTAESEAAPCAPSEPAISQQKNPAEISAGS
jgi:hypothetical protein